MPNVPHYHYIHTRTAQIFTPNIGGYLPNDAWPLSLILLYKPLHYSSIENAERLRDTRDVN
jgi:hypothetical protein